MLVRAPDLVWGPLHIVWFASVSPERSVFRSADSDHWRHLMGDERWDRFRRLAAEPHQASGDFLRRMEAYNTAVAVSAMQIALTVEIALRNVVDRELAKIHGANWYDHLDGIADWKVRDPNLTPWKEVAKAKTRASRGRRTRRVRGDVIASTSLGLWICLIRKSEIWNQVRDGAFPELRNDRLFSPNETYEVLQRPQAVITGKLETVRNMRNDAAHGRLVIDRNFRRFHDSAIRVSAAISGPLSEEVAGMPGRPNPFDFDIGFRGERKSFRAFDLATENELKRFVDIGYGAGDSP